MQHEGEKTHSKQHFIAKAAGLAMHLLGSVGIELVCYLYASCTRASRGFNFRNKRGTNEWCIVFHQCQVHASNTVYSYS